MLFWSLALKFFCKDSNYLSFMGLFLMEKLLAFLHFVAKRVAFCNKTEGVSIQNGRRFMAKRKAFRYKTQKKDLALLRLWGQIP